MEAPVVEEADEGRGVEGAEAAEEGAVVTRRRKETHAAEARTRSSGVGRRRKISAMRSLVSAATGGDGEAISSPAIGAAASRGKEV